MIVLRLPTLVTLVTATSAALWVTAALASSSYPSVIRDHLDADDAPPCTICHADLGGGNGTVITPFGEKLVTEGLGGEDEDALRRLLDELEVANSDVDGDGEGDIDELLVCGDPNEAGGNNLCAAARPTYGCAVATRSTSSVPSGAALLGAALAAAAFVRRRRS